MNTVTGQIYPTVKEALADLKGAETPDDIVEVSGTAEAIERLSRSVKQVNEIERRRAANKAARASRQANRRRG